LVCWGLWGGLGVFFWVPHPPTPPTTPPKTRPTRPKTPAPQPTHPGPSTPPTPTKPRRARVVVFFWGENPPKQALPPPPPLGRRESITGLMILHWIREKVILEESCCPIEDLNCFCSRRKSLYDDRVFFKKKSRQGNLIQPT